MRLLSNSSSKRFRVYASVNRVSIGSDNGLSPLRCQTIIWTNAGLLSIGTLGTNFSEILITIYTFSFTKMHLKLSSAKWWPFCPGGGWVGWGWGWGWVGSGGGGGGGWWWGGGGGGGEGGVNAIDFNFELWLLCTRHAPSHMHEKKSWHGNVFGIINSLFDDQKIPLKKHL